MLRSQGAPERFANDESGKRLLLMILVSHFALRFVVQT